MLGDLSPASLIISIRTKELSGFAALEQNTTNPKPMAEP